MKLWFVLCRITMYLELIPISLKLKALVTVDVSLIFKTITITLFKATLWQYTAPTIRAKLLDSRKGEVDKTGPAITPFIEDKDSERVSIIGLKSFFYLIILLGPW